jgi:hypothetical protein
MYHNRLHKTYLSIKKRFQKITYHMAVFLHGRLVGSFWCGDWARNLKVGTKLSRWFLTGLTKKML